MPHYCYRSGLQHSETDLSRLEQSWCIALTTLFTISESMRFLSLGSHEISGVEEEADRRYYPQKSKSDSLASIKRKTFELVIDNFVTRLSYCMTSDQIIVCSAISNDSSVISVKSCRLIKSHPVSSL
ncbi:hypothetical protein AVEN_172538-1 [Araneus ventricosus]|uniref:Uncharacterized protein n=1 Tax=Araneus ventricosus TaxID=182803 RepID=A0A4Y2K419_ARAVE|nr:hypothetical protein AVEN_172538-1 [Araneus ventricosus]